MPHLQLFSRSFAWLFISRLHCVRPDHITYTGAFHRYEMGTITIIFS